MATIATLVLELKLDKGGFDSDVASAKDAMDDLDSSSRNNKQSMDNLGKTAKNVGKLMVGVVAAGIAAATAAFIKSTKAAGAYDVALTTLGATLRAAGVEDFDAAIERAEQFASSLQRLTGISDVETLEAQALGAAFGLTGDSLESAVKSAAAMATVLKGNLSSSMRLVSQGLGGNIAALGRYVPALKGVKEGALTTEQILAELNKQFGDAAVAAAQNYTGRLNILQATMGDVVKETGFIFTRSKELNAVLEELEETVFGLTETIAENRDGMQSFTRDGIENAITATRVLTVVVSAAGIALNALGAIGNGLVAILVKAFEGIIRVVGSTLQEFRKVAEALGAKKIAAAFKSAEDSVEGFGDKVRDTAEVFADSSNDNIDSMAKMAKAIKTTDKAIKDFGERAKERAKDIKVLGDGARGAAADFNGLADSIDGAKRNLEAYINLGPAFGAMAAMTGEAGAQSGRDVEAAITSANMRQMEAINLAGTMGVAFGNALGQLVEGTLSGEDALKSLLGTALRVIAQIAIKQITAAALTAGAEAAKSQAGIPVVGPALAIAAMAAITAAVLGQLGSFHTGSEVLTSRDLFRLPGQRPDEGVAVLQTGERVQSRTEVARDRRRTRGDNAVITENFNQMIPTSRAALRRGLRTGGVRAEIRRSRRS